jgi:hypothetical protein
MAHAEFGFEEVVAFLHIGVECGAEAGGVFGMDAGVPVVDGVALLRGGDAEHLFPAWGEVDESGAEVPIPDAVVAAANGE